MRDRGLSPSLPSFFNRQMVVQAMVGADCWSLPQKKLRLILSKVVIVLAGNLQAPIVYAGIVVVTACININLATHESSFCFHPPSFR